MIQSSYFRPQSFSGIRNCFPTDGQRKIIIYFNFIIRTSYFNLSIIRTSYFNQSNHRQKTNFDWVATNRRTHERTGEHGNTERLENDMMRSLEIYHHYQHHQYTAINTTIQMKESWKFYLRVVLLFTHFDCFMRDCFMLHTKVASCRVRDYIFLCQLIINSYVLVLYILTLSHLSK